MRSHFSFYIKYNIIVTIDIFYRHNQILLLFYDYINFYFLFN